MQAISINLLKGKNFVVEKPVSLGKISVSQEFIYRGLIIISGALYLAVWSTIFSSITPNTPILLRPISGAVSTILAPFSKDLAIKSQLFFKPYQY